MSVGEPVPTLRERAAAARGPVAVARAGPYLCVRSQDVSGDEHVDLFEMRAGPVHLESFSGNRGLPEAALRNQLAARLGRAPELRWQPVPPAPGAAEEA